MNTPNAQQQVDTLKAITLDFAPESFDTYAYAPSREQRALPYARGINYFNPVGRQLDRRETDAIHAHTITDFQVTHHDRGQNRHPGPDERLF